MFRALIACSLFVQALTAPSSPHFVKRQHEEPEQRRLYADHKPPPPPPSDPHPGPPIYTRPPIELCSQEYDHLPGYLLSDGVLLGYTALATLITELGDLLNADSPDSPLGDVAADVLALLRPLYTSLIFGIISNAPGVSDVSAFFYLGKCGRGHNIVGEHYGKLNSWCSPLLPFYRKPNNNGLSSVALPGIDIFNTSSLITGLLGLLFPDETASDITATGLIPTYQCMDSFYFDRPLPGRVIVDDPHRSDYYSSGSGYYGHSEENRRPVNVLRYEYILEGPKRGEEEDFRECLYEDVFLPLLNSPASTVTGTYSLYDCLQKYYVRHPVQLLSRAKGYPNVPVSEPGAIEFNPDNGVFHIPEYTGVLHPQFYK